MIDMSHLLEELEAVLQARRTLRDAVDSCQDGAWGAQAKRDLLVRAETRFTEAFQKAILDTLDTPEGEAHLRQLTARPGVSRRKGSW